MADIDYSKLSDEELEKIAGGPATTAAPNVGTMSDVQLQQLADAPKPVAAQASPEIPPLVAGGTAAVMGGVPASKIAGGAAALQYGAEKAPAIIAKSADAIKNWMGTQRPGEDKYFGGKDYGDAYSRSKIAEAVPEQHPGFRMYDANGEPLIVPEKVAAARQAELTKPSKGSILTPKGVAGKVATTVAPFPAFFGAGYNAAEAFNKGLEHPVQAGISTVGGLGSLATMIPKKSFRGLGTAAAIGAPLINAVIDTARGHADGGSIQHFDKGGAAVGAVKKGGELVVDLAKKFGYNAEKVAKNYPEVIPPVLAVDPKKGTEYLAKQLSPEALGVQKARKAAQMEIDKGNYSPFFKLEERFHVDPKNYPLPQRTTELTLPKKAETVAAHRAKATDPESIRRLNEAYDRAAGHPGAHDFYAMGQLEDAFIKELGPEAGRAAFKSRFADPLAATTGGADPNSNLMTAAYTNFVRGRGEQLPEATHQLPFPIGGRFIAGNIDQARKLENIGGLDPVSNPKRYNFSSNFQGHLDRPTIDEQMMNLFDPKGPKAPQWYGINEQVVSDLAKQRGVSPVNFQEVAWAGGKNYEGKPMMQEINEMLHRTSRITGQPQEEVLKGFIHGNKPMYGIGAGAIGAGAADQDEIPHMADGKSTTPTLSDLRNVVHTVGKAVLPKSLLPSDLYDSELVQQGSLIAPKLASPLTAYGAIKAAQEGNTGEAAANAYLAAAPHIGRAIMGPLGALGMALWPSELNAGENEMLRPQRPETPEDRGMGVRSMTGRIPHMSGGGTMKRIMNEVVEGFAPKVAKEIEPGLPHTYGPQATGPWMRDYQPTTQAAPEIVYMGKYLSPTPERVRAQKAQMQADIQNAIENRKAQWLKRSREMGVSEQDIADQMNSPWGAPWMP